MLVATGYFDTAGNPCLKFHLMGVFNDPPGIEFNAIIDTGFSGFLVIPIVRAFPLGLPLNGTTSAVLADGSKSTCLTALCKLTIGTQTKGGVVMLQAASNDALLGMDFLRAFKLSLVVTKSQIILLDEDVMEELKKQGQKQTASGKKTESSTPALSPPTSASSSDANEPKPPS